MRNPIQLPLPLPDATIEIELTQGQTAIIDAVDADLAELKWCATASSHKGFYAVRNTPRPNRKLLLMHRLILERKIGRALREGEQCDHINRNKLDNRRVNLRVATSSQNNMNMGRRVDNSSGYTGVYFDANLEKWYAQIRAFGNRECLGHYSTPEEAALAYDERAQQLHGEFAVLNFPD